jgi:toxin ParE1/3/4
MRLIHFTDLAGVDYVNITRRSLKKFGLRACIRYEALIKQATYDLAIDPHRAGSRPKHNLQIRLYFYHLKHSRRSATRPVDRVQEPRHFIVYRIPNSTQIQIVRVLHERMQFSRQKYPS